MWPPIYNIYLQYMYYTVILLHIMVYIHVMYIQSCLILITVLNNTIVDNTRGKKPSPSGKTIIHIINNIVQYTYITTSSIISHEPVRFDPSEEYI